MDDRLIRYVIIGVSPDLERQKEIGAELSKISKVRHTGGSTEGLLTLEMPRNREYDVKKKMPPGCLLMTWVKYQGIKEKELKATR